MVERDRLGLLSGLGVGVSEGEFASAGDGVAKAGADAAVAFNNDWGTPSAPTNFRKFLLGSQANVTVSA